jgi:nuclease HARBI1
VDGCHIPIPAPKEDSVYYINRKGFYSVLLQGICDHETKFIDCYIGEVGSVHDATMLRRSDFYHKLVNNELGLSNNEHVLGDKAYPLEMNLLTPYKDNGHLTQRHRNFNTRLSKSRVTIERAYGLLKGRFRRLRYLDMKKLELIPMFIFACCVLHNICVDQNDELWVTPDDDEMDGDDDDPAPGAANPNQIPAVQLSQNARAALAKGKRDSLMANF